MRSSSLTRRTLAARVLALASVCAIALSGLLAAPAGAATTITATPNVMKPNTVTEFHVTGPEYLPGIHKCTVLPGTNTSTEGVVCADLFAGPASDGDLDVYPVIEAYCQNDVTSAVVACGSISFTIFLGFGNGNISFSYSAGCGNGKAACPGGRLKVSGPATEIGLGCLPGTSSEVWSVVEAGTKINLPATLTINTLPSNLASQHAIVCD
jgi:hypothetical protein